MFKNNPRNYVPAPAIYEAMSTYDENKPEFDCYRPVDYVEDCYIGDCWICDKYGNVHPDYCNSPVPIDASNIGALVTRLEDL